MTTAVLTAGEVMVLRLYSHGMTSAMVGETLCLSEAAVKSRSKRARQKLRAKTTTEGCCEAIRRGLMP